jgi:tetratricopeptide (TPR) repeat protein
MREGKLEEALELVNRSLETDETNPMAWQLRGQINSMRANYNQAIIDLNKSKSLVDDPITRAHLARAYMSADRAQDAVMELVTIMDDPKTPMAPRLLLERIYSLSGNQSAIRNFYAKMLNMFPDNITWLNKAANFAAGLNDFTTAERLRKKAWDKSLEMGQPDALSLELYLDSLLKTDQLDKLISEASQQVNSPVAPIAYAKIAEAKMKMGDKQASVDFYRKAVDAVKTNQTLVSNILRGMYGTLGADEVKKYCNQKLQENPDSLAINYVLHQMSRIEGDYNKAVTYLDKVIELVGPKTKNGLDYRNNKAQLLFSAYHIYSDNSYMDRAITVWQDLLEDLPDNSSLLNNLAYALASSDQQLKKALGYVERALEISPDSPDFLDTAAYVLYKNGRFTEAEEHAQAAVQHYELRAAYAPAEVYEHIGMIKEKLGAKDEAIAAYKKALELGQQQYTEDQVERINSTIERLSQ